MTAQKILMLALLFILTGTTQYAAAQDPDTEEPDLNDPAVQQGYREGRIDTMPGRFSVDDGENYQLLHDTTLVVEEDTLKEITKNPKLAGWLSCAVPGAGQIYNGQYWKVPIIYGGFGTLIYVSQFYNIRYKQLKNDELYLLAQINGDSTYTGKSFYGLTTENDIVRYMRKYRRYRDLCYLGMFLVYMMNIFDAVVDAHLYDYDVSDDISLRLEPYATEQRIGYAAPVFGARIVVTF
ncbi:MAG: hypothetical protein K6F33_07375 [Bacteroidales bacterium]|nr:hypothetical protein [Bacteroidales bacterium]